jgi:hypothetical protein
MESHIFTEFLGVYNSNQVNELMFEKHTKNNTRNQLEDIKTAFCIYADSMYESFLKDDTWSFSKNDFDAYFFDNPKVIEHNLDTIRILSTNETEKLHKCLDSVLSINSKDVDNNLWYYFDVDDIPVLLDILLELQSEEKEKILKRRRLNRSRSIQNMEQLLENNKDNDKVIALLFK